MNKDYDAGSDSKGYCYVTANMKTSPQRLGEQDWAVDTRPATLQPAEQEHALG
jgi:hypothetical protein